MRFSEDFRDSVGFVLDDGDPCGTFFVIRSVVTQPGQQPRSFEFLITARHCLKDVTTPGVRYRGRWSRNNPIQQIPEWDVPLDDWVLPSDDDLDLAVASFSPPIPVASRAIPSEFATSVVGRSIDLGELVYYVGLWDVSALDNRGAVPLVRSGHVAALNEPNIRVYSEHTRGKVERVIQDSHLIDVRPRMGFSGGPVFVQRPVAREWRNPVPAEWTRRATGAGTNVQTWMEVTTFTDLWGMFVGLADVSGIGVVLPVEHILAFLESPEVQSLANQ